MAASYQKQPFFLAMGQLHSGGHRNDWYAMGCSISLLWTRTMPPLPTMFIGSSSEGLPAAEAMQILLQRDAEVEVWNQGVFELSKGYLETLEDKLDRVDFAAMVLTADDQIVSRGATSPSARDNVLFELGMFIGRLGRERCYFVLDAAHPVKLPSDLGGIVSAKFTPPTSTGNMTASMGPTCTRIRELIRRLGPRLRVDQARLDATATQQRFSESLCGPWWEWITPVTGSALSLATISLEPASGTIRIDARSFTQDGSPAAHWRSRACGIDLSERRVVFRWTGEYPERISEPYDGVGEMTFRELRGSIEQASGFFWDINTVSVAATTKKHIELRRATVEEALTVHTGDRTTVADLVKRKLESRP